MSEWIPPLITWAFVIFFGIRQLHIEMIDRVDYGDGEDHVRLAKAAIKDSFPPPPQEPT